MSATAADYRLRPAEIRADWCQARRLGDVNKDTRWSPAVYREVQCEKPPASASGLCAQCQRNMENYTGSIKSHWTGRITEEPFKYQHMLGTEWAVSNIASDKLVWNGGPAPAWWRPTPVIAFNVPEEAPAPFAFNVPEEAMAEAAPVDPCIAALEERNAALERDLATERARSAALERDLATERARSAAAHAYIATLPLS